MRQQTGRVAQRCYGSLITIRKIRDTLPRTTVNHLIRALVFPHLTYCLPAWAPPTKQDRQRLEKVVNHAARIVTRKRKFEHISKARQGLGWLSFDDMINYRDSIFVRSLLYQEHAPEHLKALAAYRAEISQRHTRTTAAGLLHVPRVRLEKNTHDHASSTTDLLEHPRHRNAQLQKCACFQATCEENAS